MQQVLGRAVFDRKMGNPRQGALTLSRLIRVFKLSRLRDIALDELGIREYGGRCPAPMRVMDSRNVRKMDVYCIVANAGECAKAMRLRSWQGQAKARLVSLQVSESSNQRCDKCEPKYQNRLPGVMLAHAAVGGEFVHRHRHGAQHLDTRESDARCNIGESAARWRLFPEITGY